jgi:hypothetical protein
VFVGEGVVSVVWVMLEEVKWVGVLEVDGRLEVPAPGDEVCEDVVPGVSVPDDEVSEDDAGLVEDFDKVFEMGGA